MKRQGLIVTIRELENLIDELKRENNKDGIKFQINIINKTPECSDTWKIEDLKDSEREQ